MDTFNDASLTPDQIKMLTLQFMGQHLTGELKELDKNLVAKNQTLQGMVLDPTAVLNSIPSTTPPAVISYAQPQPVPELTTTVPTANPALSVQPTTAQPIQVAPIQDPNQLEFSFETSPLSERIFNTLDRIEKKLALIDEKLLALEDSKKKD
jgi:hypothetical protein